MAINTRLWESEAGYYHVQKVEGYTVFACKPPEGTLIINSLEQYTVVEKLAQLGLRNQFVTPLAYKRLKTASEQDEAKKALYDALEQYIKEGHIQVTKNGADGKGVDVVLLGTQGEMWCVNRSKLNRYTDGVGKDAGYLFEGEGTVPWTRVVAKAGDGYAAFVPYSVKGVNITTEEGAVLGVNEGPQMLHGNGDFIVTYKNEDGSIAVKDGWVVNGNVFKNTYNWKKARMLEGVEISKETVVANYGKLPEVYKGASRLGDKNTVSLLELQVMYTNITKGLPCAGDSYMVEARKGKDTGDYWQSVWKCFDKGKLFLECIVSNADCCVPCDAEELGYADSGHMLRMYKKNSVERKIIGRVCTIVLLHLLMNRYRALQPEVDETMPLVYSNGVLQNRKAIKVADLDADCDWYYCSLDNDGVEIADTMQKYSLSDKEVTEVLNAVRTESNGKRAEFVLSISDNMYDCVKGIGKKEIFTQMELNELAYRLCAVTSDMINHALDFQGKVYLEPIGDGVNRFYGTLEPRTGSIPQDIEGDSTLEKLMAESIELNALGKCGGSDKKRKYGVKIEVTPKGKKPFIFEIMDTFMLFEYQQDPSYFAYEVAEVLGISILKYLTNLYLKPTYFDVRSGIVAPRHVFCRNLKITQGRENKDSCVVTFDGFPSYVSSFSYSVKSRADMDDEDEGKVRTRFDVWVSSDVPELDYALRAKCERDDIRDIHYSMSSVKFKHMGSSFQTTKTIFKGLMERVFLGVGYLAYRSGNEDKFLNQFHQDTPTTRKNMGYTEEDIAHVQEIGSSLSDSLNKVFKTKTLKQSATDFFKSSNHSTVAWQGRDITGLKPTTMHYVYRKADSGKPDVVIEAMLSGNDLSEVNTACSLRVFHRGEDDTWSMIGYITPEMLGFTPNDPVFPLFLLTDKEGMNSSEMQYGDFHAHFESLCSGISNSLYEQLEHYM